MERMLPVAVLATDGVERSELERPIEALREAGLETLLVSDREDHIATFEHLDRSGTAAVDVSVDGAAPGDFCALILPGGVANPDALRLVPSAVAFVRAFFEAGKPVAAICHGPWTLVEADVVRGRTITSWPSLQTDLRNAGANWVDEEVVVDGNLVSSRKPDDLPAFTAKLVEVMAAAGPAEQSGR